MIEGKAQSIPAAQSAQRSAYESNGMIHMMWPLHAQYTNLIFALKSIARPDARELAHTISSPHQDFPFYEEMKERCYSAQQLNQGTPPNLQQLVFSL